MSLLSVAVNVAWSQHDGDNDEYWYSESEEEIDLNSIFYGGYKKSLMGMKTNLMKKKKKMKMKMTAMGMCACENCYNFVLVLGR